MEINYRGFRLVGIAINNPDPAGRYRVTWEARRTTRVDGVTGGVWIHVLAPADEAVGVVHAVIEDMVRSVDAVMVYDRA